MATLESIEAGVNELLRRIGGSTTTPPPGEVPPGFVLTPRGRLFPAPQTEAGEMFVGYTMRVGDYLGGEQQRIGRANAGALFITSTSLLAKHANNWAAACEEHLFGDPNYRPDPGWGFSPGPPR